MKTNVLGPVKTTAQNRVLKAYFLEAFRTAAYTPVDSLSLIFGSLLASLWCLPLVLAL